MSYAFTKLRLSTKCFFITSSYSVMAVRFIRRVTLLDSLNKRIRFLDTVIEEMGLTDVEAVHGRAEDFARPGKLRESFDLCVSRAVIFDLNPFYFLFAFFFHRFQLPSPLKTLERTTLIKI